MLNLTFKRTMGIVILILVAITILLLREIGILLVLLYIMYIIIRKISKGKWLKQGNFKTSKLIIPILKHVNIDSLSIIDNTKLELIGLGKDLPYAIIRYGFFNVTGIGVLMLQLPKDRLDHIKALINDILRTSIRGQIIISTNSESNELKVFSIVKSSRDTLPCGLLKRKVIDELISEVAVGLKITSSHSSSFKILKASEIPILFKEVFT